MDQNKAVFNKLLEDNNNITSNSGKSSYRDSIVISHLDQGIPYSH